MERIMIKLDITIIGCSDVRGNKNNGIYYPTHIKHSRVVAARWETTAVVNTTNSNRTAHVRLTAWNGMGTNLADTLATTVRAGDKLTCDLELITFQKRVFINGAPILQSNGTPLTVLTTQFIILNVEKHTPYYSNTPDTSNTDATFGNAKVLVNYNDYTGPITVRYRLHGYTSAWVVKVDSIAQLTDNLTNNRAAFKTTDNTVPVFSLLEIL